MPLPRVLEPEVMSGAEEAGEYQEMDFSATDLLFAERAAQLARAAGLGADRSGTNRSGANRSRANRSRANRSNLDLIADLGSGNAKIPLALCRLLPDATRICAVEMSREMLNVAAGNRARDAVSPSRLILVEGNAKQTPFADHSIGMITSNSLVHHIPEPRAVFQEIARIARPGAPLLIRDLVRPESEQAVEQLLETHGAPWSPLQRTLFSDSLHAALTLDEVREMLKECSLPDVTVSQTSDRHWSAERA